VLPSQIKFIFMYRSLFFFMLVLSVTISKQSNGQMVMSSESFDNTTFAPAGWSIKPDLGPQNVWVRRTNSTNPTAIPHSGPGMARFSSRNVIAGTKQLLVSRPIDYTNRGVSPANVTFWMYRDNINANYDSITVWVNSSDTLTASAVKLGTIVRNRTYAMPDTQSTDDWYMYSFAIPTSFSGNTTTRFIFEGTSESPVANQGAHQYIDDISFEEYPPICAGIPNSGSIVNSTPLICGGGGTTNLSLSAAISNQLGISYDWQMASNPAGPWTSFGTNASSVVSNTLNSNTYFQCVVTCSYSGLNYTTAIDSSIISLNPIPVVVASPSPANFCAGTTGVTISVTGANTYVWSPSTGLNSSTSATVIASPTVSTAYTVMATDSNGCQNYTTVDVILRTPPNIGITANPSDTVCSGTTVYLNSIPGGNTPPNTLFAWSDGKTTRRDTVVVTTTTTLSVIVTNSVGCSSYDTITLYALPAQTSNFGWMQNGATFNFGDSTANSTNWTWNFGDGNSSTNQNPTYTYSAPGSYVVTLIVTGPCKTDTITKTVEVWATGMEQIEQRTTGIIYPNPTSNLLNIETNGLKHASLEIVDLAGRDYFIETIEQTTDKIQLNVSALPIGLYFLRIKTPDGTKVYKFSKQL
jgi:hypothetical protein